MVNDKCIYCKKEDDFNREHAFPQSLLDDRLLGTEHEWIIDRHLCTKCNSDLGKLDAILAKRSPLAFVWDQIQNELGNTTQTPHSSIYLKKAAGINPLGLFYPDPHYDNLIVLHEAKTVNNHSSAPIQSATALRPQMVLTQCPQGKSVEEVIAENCARYYTTGLEGDRIESSDELGEVHCFFGNTYIFPPKTSEHFFHRIPEFKAEFLTDFPNTQYGLTVICPEEGKCQQAAKDLYNSFEAETKEIIEGEKSLNLEPVEHFVEVRADRKAMPDVARAIAKVAFHCFLFHHPQFSGHESIFKDIKEFIYFGSRNKFVVQLKHSNAENLVYDSNEHQHHIFFYLKGSDIGCQMHLFTGLSTEPFFYQIILAGDPDNLTLNPNRVVSIPFFVHLKSQMKRRIHRAENLGIIHIPGPYEGLLLLPRYSF